MEKKSMTLNTVLAVFLGAVLLLEILGKTFFPAWIVPKPDIPLTGAVVLAALVTEAFLSDEEGRSWGIQIILGAVTFAVLPRAAGLSSVGINQTIWRTVTFAVLTWMFDWMKRRLSATTNRKGAILSDAFVLYLAFQCFMGIIL